MQRMPEAWPRIVKRGGSEVRIYRINNRGRTAYQTAHWLCGKRVLKNFARFAAAQAHAEAQATLLNAGKLEVAQMTVSDRESLVAARRALAPLGIPLLEAVHAFVGATRELNGRGTLLEAAREYRKRHETAVPAKPVAEVVSELLSAKQQDAASDRYMKTLRSHLARSEEGARKRNSFADAFNTYIGSVSAKQIDDWLRKRGVGARTRKNLLGSIRVLFNYAKARGYLAKNQPTEADAVPIPKVRGGDIGILSPDDLKRLLAGTDRHPAHEEYQLWLALGAFTGLRTQEMLRLEWRHIMFATGYIQVMPAVAKTAARRLIPILPNLRMWLQKWEGRSGKVFPRARADERVHAYAARLGLEWPPNALRHSFATYRLAATHEIGRTAQEMGNSPAVIVKHYRELATEEEGIEWFGIAPQREPANVVSIRADAA